MSSVPTVLRPERQSLLPGIGCSVVLHVGLVLTAVLFSALSAHCGASRPIVDLDRTMEVSLIAASDLSVPERATRAPVPRGAEQPVPKPAEVEPPPVQSDLAYHTDEAETHEGTDSRDAALEELERQRLLEELMNAPEGTTNRRATDPNGTGDITINPGAAAAGDPEYAAYIAKVQSIFMQHFKPLAAITEDRPDLVCKVHIEVDPDTMAVLSYAVVQSSGVSAYDAAAERAAAAVTSLPPPPERYRALLAGGYTMNFRAN